jgi:hypothetical protein
MAMRREHLVRLPSEEQGVGLVHLLDDDPQVILANEGALPASSWVLVGVPWTLHDSIKGYELLDNDGSHGLFLLVNGPVGLIGCLTVCSGGAPDGRHSIHQLL